MKIVLIDSSGSLPEAEIARIRKELRVGDRVICFDTRPYVIGTMKSQDHINTFQFMGGGGSLLCPALKLVVDENLPIYVYTDGFLHDLDEAVAMVTETGAKVILKQVGDWGKIFADVKSRFPA